MITHHLVSHVSCNVLLPTPIAHSPPMHPSYKATFSLLGHKDSITALSFSPNGTKLASAGIDGILFIWSTNQGRRLYQHQHGCGYTSAIWLDNTSVLAGTEDGKLYLLQALEVGFPRMLHVSPFTVYRGHCIVLTSMSCTPRTPSNASYLIVQASSQQGLLKMLWLYQFRPQKRPVRD